MRETQISFSLLLPLSPTFSRSLSLSLTVTASQMVAEAERQQGFGRKWLINSHKVNWACGRFESVLSASGSGGFVALVKA